MMDERGMVGSDTHADTDILQKEGGERERERERDRQKHTHIL